MSEIIHPPKSPATWAQKAVATTALFGALTTSACSGNVAHSDALPSTNPDAGTNICPPLDQGQVTELGRYIQDTIATGAQENDRPSAYWAKKYGVQINTTSTHTMDKINAGRTASQKLAIANKLAQQKYGFTIKLADTSKPKDINFDLQEIAEQLEFMPVSLVDNLNIGTVTLESPEPAKKDPPAGAFAILDPKAPNDIVVGPNEAEAIIHETGHHLQGEYQQATCTKLVNYDDPSFTSLNPADFVYTGHEKNPESGWKGKTFGEYGQKNHFEDEATTFDALADPTPDNCKDIVRSDVLASKVAEVARRANRIARNAGNYLVNRMISRCVHQYQ